MARIGGDEFIILAEGDRNALEKIKARIQKGAEEWIGSGEIKAHTGISVGIAIWEPGMTVDQLLNYSDREMYEEKRRHKKGIHNR